MKKISKKYTQILLWLCIFFWSIVIVYIVIAYQNITQFRFDDQLKSQFWSWIFDYRSDIDFKFGGNQKAGIFFSRSLETLSIPEVVTIDSINTGLCYGKIRWLYYNNQRGERVRPIDENTLTWLQGIDSSYAVLQLSGGLFTNCTGLSGTSGNVYGQVTLIYNNSNTYYLIAGTDYNFSGNIHGTNLSWSTQRVNDKLRGYVWDSFGGIWMFVSNPPTVIIETWAYQIFSGTAISWGQTVDIDNTTFIINSTNTDGMTWYIIIANAGSILVSGWNWSGEILPPTLIDVNSGEAASRFELGNLLYSDGIIYATFKVWAANDTSLSLLPTGNFLISIYVPTAQVWQTLGIYRSSDGNTWALNIPDSQCILDANKYCNFATDHLSYFTVFSPSDWIKTTINQGQICTDYDGCIVLIPQVNTGSSRSSNLMIDDCSLSSNLLWNNSEGIDYSPSYYDRDCGQAYIQVPETVVAPSYIPVTCSAYSDELNAAYEFAYSAGITTINQCEKANMKWLLIRAHMAKMIVNYAVNVLGRIPDPSINCEFNDIGNQSWEMQWYIKQACQLWLMWVDIKFFSPTKTVTRAQFGTVLSRLLWGDLHDGPTPYYAEHLTALQEESIISVINPDLKELRGYIMLMLMRAQNQ